MTGPDKDHDATVTTEGSVKLSSRIEVTSKGELLDKLIGAQNFLNVIRGRQFLVESASAFEYSGLDFSREDVGTASVKYQDECLKQILTKQILIILSQSKCFRSYFPDNIRERKRPAREEKYVENGMAVLWKGTIKLKEKPLPTWIDSYERLIEKKKMFSEKLDSIKKRHDYLKEVEDQRNSETEKLSKEMFTKLQFKKNQVLFLCDVIKMLICKSGVDLQKHEFLCDLLLNKIIVIRNMLLFEMPK